MRNRLRNFYLYVQTIPRVDYKSAYFFLCPLTVKGIRRFYTIPENYGCIHRSQPRRMQVEANRRFHRNELAVDCKRKYRPFPTREKSRLNISWFFPRLNKSIQGYRGNEERPKAKLLFSRINKKDRRRTVHILV